MEALVAVEGFDPEVVEKLGKMKAQFEKKGSALRKPTATQVENEGIKATILEVLAAGDNLTVSEVVAALGNKFSNQKVSALMAALVKEGKVEKVVDKRKSLFHLV